MDSKLLATSPEQACVCGRLKDKVHCPRQGCGSYTVYALVGTEKFQVPMADGTGRPSGLELDAQRFRCRRCGKTFNEGEQKFSCEAPAVAPTKRLEKVIAEKAQSLVLNAIREQGEAQGKPRREIIADMLAAKGIVEKKAFGSRKAIDIPEYREEILAGKDEALKGDLSHDETALAAGQYKDEFFRGSDEPED